MTFKDFIANREGVPLSQHLYEVGELSYSYICRASLGSDFGEIARLNGYLHDIGKYTDFFQKKIRGKKLSSYEMVRSKHAFISSVLAVNIYDEMFDDQGEDKYVALYYLAIPIASHHSWLKSPNNLRNALNNGYSIVVDQLEDLRKKRFKIRDDLSCFKRLDEIGDLLSKILTDPTRIVEKFAYYIFKSKMMGLKEPFEIFFYTKLFFSTLIDADKKVSSTYHLEPSYTRLSYRHVYDAINERIDTSTRLNRLRKLLFETVNKKLRRDINSIAENDVIILNAPTGAGKTLLGLLTATCLREHLEKVTGHKYKIIYLLPYINIVEQTYQVIRNIIGQDNAYGIMKYHHLYFPLPDKDEDTSIEDKLLYVDSWESDVIISTYNQVIDALVGGYNRRLKKLHNICNSIIILDEIQTLPMEYWLLIRELIGLTSKYLGIRYIFMTATLPTMFTNYKNIKIHFLTTNKMVRDEIGWDINRWMLRLDIEKEVEVDELISFVIKEINNVRSLLLVVNTVSRAKELYIKLRDRLKNNYSLIEISGDEEECCDDINNHTIFITNLSSVILPIHRLRRIENLKKVLKKGGKALLISTQVIEAGVDIDFEGGIRDIAPLDSLIQVSGRCNRNYILNDASEIRVIKLDEDAVKIYRKLSIDITSNLLDLMAKNNGLYEVDLLNNLERYYEEIIKKERVLERDESHKVLEKMRRLEFDADELYKLSLYREPPQISVYIEWDDRAYKIREEINILVENLRTAIRGKKDLKDIISIRNQIRMKMIEANEYIVSYYPDKLPYSEYTSWENTGLFYVPKDLVNRYYDLMTGLIFKDEFRSEHWIID